MIREADFAQAIGDRERCIRLLKRTYTLLDASLGATGQDPFACQAELSHLHGVH